MIGLGSDKNESFRSRKVNQLVVCRILGQSQTRDGATNCVGAFHVFHNKAFVEHQQNELKRLNISLAFESWRGLGAFIENGQLKSLCTSFQRLFLAKCKNHSQHRLKICSKRNWRKKLQSWNRRLRMLVPIQVWMETTRAAILVIQVHSDWLQL